MIDLSPLVAQAGPRSLPYFDPSFPDRLLILHAARPRDWSSDDPVVFVHHGVARNGRDYRDYWLPHVDQGGFLAIAIEFPEASFPDILVQFRQPVRRGRQTESAPPMDLWDRSAAVRGAAQPGDYQARRYGVFGHSAGGQYVHRMLSFGYRDRVAVAVTANAGTYAMPDLAIDWPWGLGATEVTPDDLKTFLGFPVTIMAGTEDIKTTGRFFPKGPKSLRQGPTRFARAHRYLQTGQEAAAELGVSLAWRVVEVPGVGHDGRGMSDAAAPLIAGILRGAAERSEFA